MGSGNLKLIILTAHLFNQNGEMQFATTGDPKTDSLGERFHLQGYIGQRFTAETFLNMTGGYIFTILTGKGRVIGNKVHGNGGRINLDQGQGLRIIGIGKGHPDCNVGHSCHGNDLTGMGSLYRHLLVALETKDFVNTH